MSFDWDTATTVGGVCAAAIGTLGGIVLKGVNARIKKVEDVIPLKADDAELQRQRGHIVDLFEENKEIRKDMNGGFSALRDEMHTIHLDLIDRLGQLRG